MASATGAWVTSAAWITGAGGFVGSHLLAGLAEADWRIVRSRVRPGVPPTVTPKPNDVVFHTGGLAGGRASRSQYLAANCELPVALYHLAADAHCRGFVFLSSAKVLGEGCPAPVDEGASRNPMGAYAKSKAAGEERLLAAHAKRGLPLAIVRPPLVYGRGVKGRFRLLLWCLARAVPVPFADATGARSWVSATNLADALAVVGTQIGKRLTGASVWHVTDGLDISTVALCRTLASHLGKEAVLWGLPSPVRTALGRFTGRVHSAAVPLRLRADALGEQFGWSPPQPVEDALAETARWFVEARASRRLVAATSRRRRTR